MFDWAGCGGARGAARRGAGASGAAAMDVGTSFAASDVAGNVIATLAEPAMLLVVLTLALSAGTTRLAGCQFYVTQPWAVRVSLALALVALIIVALAENARIPVDNPSHPPRADDGAQAIVLEIQPAFGDDRSSKPSEASPTSRSSCSSPLGMAPAAGGLRGRQDRSGARCFAEVVPCSRHARRLGRWQLGGGARCPGGRGFRRGVVLASSGCSWPSCGSRCLRWRPCL